MEVTRVKRKKGEKNKFVLKFNKKKNSGETMQKNVLTKMCQSYSG